MPEEDALLETSNTDHKSRIRHRLREKLSRRDSKPSTEKETREQDIQSFLHAPNHERLATTVSEIDFPPNLNPTLGTHLPYNIKSSQVKSKRPRQPNLSVQFVTAAPTIIGEGGDEAVQPVVELQSFRLLASEPGVESSSKPNSQISGTEPRPDSPRYHGGESEVFRPKDLQRRSTGLQDYRAEGSPEHDSIDNGSNKEITKTSGTFHSSLNNKTLGEDPQLVRSVLAESRNPFDQALSQDSGVQDQSSHSLGLPMQGPATSFANSLTPLIFPQTPRSLAASTNLDPAFAASSQHVPHDPAINSRRSPEQETQQSGRLTAPKVAAEKQGPSLRNVAKGLGDDAYSEFAARVHSFRNVFFLGLDARTEPSLQDWVTAASWWFLKGRSELESSVRSEPKGSADEVPSIGYVPHNFRQAYVDLAKSWWIVAEITPSRYPEVKRLESQGPVSASAIMQSFVDATTAELVQAHLSVMSNLRALTMSMKRNGRLPPVGLEMQGLDTRVFIPYPKLSSSAARLLSPSITVAMASQTHGETTSFFPMPIKDTERHFNYGRVFVEVVLEKSASQTTLPCLLTILRNKEELETTLTVISQDWQVLLIIQPEASGALSWKDAHWETSRRCIRLEIQADFQARIQMTEEDFRTVWGIDDYTRTVQKQSRASRNEELVFERALRSFQYFDTSKAISPFPVQPVEDCKLRLFECFKLVAEASGKRKMHDGFRLIVVTARKTKTLSSVSHNIGRRSPIIFSYLRDEHGAPAILLKMSKSSRDPSMVMSFEHQADRERLYSLLNGPGELRMRLDPNHATRIRIPRDTQSDMTMCFADSTLSKELYESLRQELDSIAQSPSVRVFDFRSLKDLHIFQALTTGFSVIFDGFAKTFAISRRRMVVPIHKRWEASMTRLQVVKHEKNVQLVAFFQNFSHGSCMNFLLKSTDAFESFSRSGTPYVCMVDAKFALLKEESESDQAYACLAMPEYPAEHDDITIGFTSDE
ncbi:MAG: hypothetical protein Q9207_005027, partial [Kuettlingeria erythrocarpa]